MFKKLHHQKIASVLAALDSRFLEDAECFFGGGTAISMLLDEYRESVDIDFICASPEGYRKLRSAIFDRGLGAIFTAAPIFLREPRVDRDKVFAHIDVAGTPIRFEVVLEGRIKVSGALNDFLGVPTLLSEDMYAEKLLANADRYMDDASMNRDIIDLAIMIERWGAIPDDAFRKADAAYGVETIRKAFDKAIERVSDPDRLRKYLKRMDMSEDWLGIIPSTLFSAQSLRPPI